MTDLTIFITKLLSILVVISDVVIIGLVLWSFHHAYTKKEIRRTYDDVIEYIGTHALMVGLVATLGAVAGSFYYSNVAGFAPCNLCWYQRIFVFSQLPIFVVALWRKDNTILYYSAALSFVGALFAVYHYYGQMFNVNAIPCAVGAVSCAKREFVEFGYVTLPMMSLTYFAFMLFLMYARRMYVKARGLMSHNG